MTASVRPFEPVTGPAAWHGRDMARREEWKYELSPGDLDEIRDAIASVRRDGRAIIDVDADSFVLPSLGSTLRRIRRDLVDGRGFVLIRGIPVADWSREDVALSFWGLGKHLGEPIMQNRRGHVLGHVTDIGVDPTNPKFRGYQSSADLSPHTDVASDLVALLCLRPAKSGGLSMVASSAAIHNEVLRRRPDLARVLAEPFHLDRREEIPEGKAPHYALPVFNYHEGHLTVSFVRRFVESAQRFPDVPRLTAEQVEALDLMDELAQSEDIRLDMDFRPGDMQVVNNLIIMHSRTAYEDWPEPERRRHLLRLWLAVPEGWPLPPAYFERYEQDRHGRPRGVSVPGSVPVVSLEPV